MRFLLAGFAACLIAAPAMAQKFVSVTGDSTRMTVGAIAAEEIEDIQETAQSDPAATPVEGEEVAAAEEPAEIDLEPATINFGDPVETFIPDAGECNSGSLWNQETGRCETF